MGLAAHNLFSAFCCGMCWHKINPKSLAVPGTAHNPSSSSNLCNTFNLQRKQRKQICAWHWWTIRPLILLLKLRISTIFLQTGCKKQDKKQFTSTSQAYSDPSRSVTLHCMFFGFLTIFRGDLESLLDDDFWESLSSSSCWYSSCFALAAANSCSLSVGYKEKERYFLKGDEPIMPCKTLRTLHPSI